MPALHSAVPLSQRQIVSIPDTPIPMS